jgi:hypothetical protein
MLDVFVAMERELRHATPTGVRARLGLIRRRSLEYRYYEIADGRSAEFTEAWRAFIDAAGGLAAAALVEEAQTSRSPALHVSRGG